MLKRSERSLGLSRGPRIRKKRAKSAKSARVQCERRAIERDATLPAMMS